MKTVTQKKGVSSIPPAPLSVCLQLLEEPVEVIGNALELRAFDRMEEDIRLVGYFKNEDSEREYFPLWVCEELCFALYWNRVHLTLLICVDLQLRFYPRRSHSCCE